MAAVAFGDGAGDGEAEAGAFLAAAEDAVEGVEHAAAFGGGDAGAVVFDAEDDVAGRFFGTQVDLAAGRGVADGVVGQGFDQGVEVGFVGVENGVGGAGYAEVLLFGFGQGQEVFDYAAEEVLAGQALLGALGFGGLGAGEGEELLEQAAVAVDALQQAGELAGSGFGQAVGGQALGLQGEGGHGAAQFVGGIGDEALLLLHGLMGALKQAVNGLDETADFIGDVFGAQRGEVAAAARFEALGKAVHGLHGEANDEDGEQDAEGGEQDERHGAVPGGMFGHVFAEVVFLEHGNGPLGGVADVGSVGVITIGLLEGVQAFGQVRGQGDVVVIIVVIVIVGSSTVAGGGLDADVGVALAFGVFR